MNSFLRYSGRILLALGVVALALWATRNKLIDIPPYQFWTGIVCYLIAAEAAWTIADWRGVERELRLPRKGLYQLLRWERAAGTVNKWLFDGGRLRMADLLARHDSNRDVLQSLLEVLLTREPGPRVHVLSGPVGSGRTVMLGRLGRMLAEARQTVFVAVPGAGITALDKVLQAARTKRTYLLIDDLDLRPQAEDWLYEIDHSGLPITVIGTLTEAEAEEEVDGLGALHPVGLLAKATVHTPQISSNDLAALSHKLGSLGRLQQSGLTSQASHNMIAAMRHLQGRQPEQGLWENLTSDSNLPLQQALMIALAGVAEVGLPQAIQTVLFGDKEISKWRRAGLLAADTCLMLPPHHLTCLDRLRTVRPESEPAAALAAMTAACLPISPIFTVRLLYGLNRCPETQTLAQAEVTRLLQAEVAAKWSGDLHRAWRRLLCECNLPLAVEAIASEYPPETQLAGNAAFLKGDYQQALELFRILLANPTYQLPARFNMALALVHLGCFAEAREELQKLQAPPAGTQYLQGVIAELQENHMAAIAAYEASRQAGELPVAATLRLALCYLRSGAPRIAIPLFEILLSHVPDRAEVYGGLAVAHLHIGMTQRAAAQSARAIQAGVDPVVARKAVARACVEARAYGRAAAELEACLAYDQDDLEAWRELAVVCRWLGRYSREEECLRHLQAAEPDSVQMHLDIARCQRDQDRAADCLTLLEPLLSGEKAPVAAFLLAAETAGALNDLAGQQRYATLALAHGDNSGWGQFWLADSKHELSPTVTATYRQAIRGFKQALVEGATPRRAARLWQGIYLSAKRLEDESLTQQAARKAQQAVSVCETCGAEVESVVHRRSVSANLFLETLSPTVERPRKVENEA